MKRKTISIIRVCFWTKKAETLFEKIKLSLSEILWTPINSKENLSLWTKDSFEKSLPILFIGATGIAVRTISPFIKSKGLDSPVIVIDEDGKFVIPILSGHLGNANEIAKIISKSINAQAVITTATDINQKFSIDTFARLNGFNIYNLDGIKKVSAKILSDKKIHVFIEEDISIKTKNIPNEIILTKKYNANKTDVVITTKEFINKYKSCDIILFSKKYCLGIGCKKGKEFSEIKSFINEVINSKLSSNNLNDVYSISSIDLKEKEIGLLQLSHYMHIPFITFSAEELKLAKGNFTESFFVKKITGVSNICERAALLSSGKNGKIIVKKTSKNGITISIAEKKPEIEIWETSLLREL